MHNDENTKSVIHEIRIVHAFTVLILIVQLMILSLGFLGFISMVDSMPKDGILEASGSVPATGETDNGKESDRQVRP